MFKKNIPRSMNEQKASNTAPKNDKNNKMEKSTYQTELMAKEERPIFKFTKSIL